MSKKGRNLRKCTDASSRTDRHAIDVVCTEQTEATIVKLHMKKINVGQNLAHSVPPR